jgi:hypothetical protein
MMDVNMRQQLVCNLSVGHCNREPITKLFAIAQLASSRIQPHPLSRSTSQTLSRFVTRGLECAAFARQ